MASGITTRKSIFVYTTAETERQGRRREKGYFEFWPNPLLQTDAEYARLSTALAAESWNQHLAQLISSRAK